MKFKVYWKSQSIREAKSFHCGSQEQAKEMFLKDNAERNEPLIIESEEGIVEKEVVASENSVSQSFTPTESLNYNAISTLKVEQKLDEIHSTLKLIRWAIWGLFTFTVLVVVGIIKPGFFG
jgi:hypothetical protein